MNKKLIARTAKLLSEAKKGRRFKGVAITYEHIPADLDERLHGSIYAIINVNAPSPEAEGIAELIIDTFHGEFYQNVNENPLTSFEASLAKINEELAEATHQGDIAWLNNLNAIVGVLTDNVLHISQAGKAEAYLYRGERTSHISDDLAGDGVNPLRTFVNIASGELVEGDKVVFVTPSVFYHVSKDELKRYVKDFQPRVAISHIADLLEGTSNEMNPNAVLILEAITPEAASNETLDQQPDEVWISEPAKPVETAIDTAKPFLKKAFEVTTVGVAATREFLGTKALPFAKEAFGRSKDTIANLRGQKTTKKDKTAILVKGEEAISIKENSYHSSIETLEESDEVISETESKPKKNEFYIKETANKPKWLKLEKVDLSAAKKFGLKAKNIGKKYSGNKKQLAIMIAIALVVLSAGTFVVWKQRDAANSLKMAKATLEEARSKLEIGKTETANGSRGQAAADLNAAKSLAESLKGNDSVKADAASLLIDIQKVLDEAENVQRPATNKVADAASIVGKNPLGPFAVKDNLYLINPENGQIAAVNTKNNEVSNVLNNPKIEGKVLAATAVTARRILALVTDQGNIYEFDTVESTLSKQTVSGDVEKPVSMAAYSTNIYTLTSDGKIYKRVKVTGGYGKRSEYITDSNYQSSARSISIDSNIYVLNSAGAVNKYLVGKKEDFSITDSPITMDKANTIYTSETTTGLFITNNDRVVRTDDKGKFISQYASDNFSQLGGIYIDDTAKKAYISTNGTIWSFSY